MSFFKNDNGNLLEGPNFVLGPDYELRAETHTEHTYPVDGWWWFDTELDAQAFFGMLPGAALDARLTDVENALSVVAAEMLGGPA